MLECKNLCANNIINSISFRAKSGTTTAIVGKNGSGKTTLAKCIMNENKFIGDVIIDGVSQIPFLERSKKIAYLPQSLPSPIVSVYELVMLGRTPHTAFATKISNDDLAAIDYAINTCGLSNLKDRALASLSGGEKQRAFLAMLLAKEAEILLLDEPTSSLDMAAAAEFCELLSSLEKTLIIIMHDLSLAIKHADNVLILDEGKQVFFGSKDECLDSKIIEQVFGVRKIEANGEFVFLV